MNARELTPVCARSHTSQSCLLIVSQNSTVASGLNSSGSAIVSGRNMNSLTTVVWFGPFG